MSHYKIAGPALISFSGGRTSGFMLHQIVQAHGGTLPDGVRVCFANTGKEREETLRFVHECGSRWGVRVHWVEWRDGKPGFEEVGYNSASRSGEPFAALIAKKKRLPNQKERWCTEFLKVRPMFSLMKSELGLVPGQYTEVIGLRHDEDLRIFRGFERADEDGRRVAYPLANDKILRTDVMEFWSQQSFDLGLMGYEGNCDLCFLKGAGKRQVIMRERPGCSTWWIEQERATNGFFDRRSRYADLQRVVSRSPLLPFVDDEGDHDAECGLHCAA